MQFLFEIEDVFDISGRGCVLVPGVPDSLRRYTNAGDQILIISPEGEQLQTSIAAFEMIERGRPMVHAAFSLPGSVDKASLPIGSKVYHLDGSDF